mmetsp:Transcript_32502/g.71526  ORF Transcript_32502/g.71526 Transcript_32502/m.71526 type:complete len:258 (-) Transcript_32502:1093-1866(-)
MASPSTAHSRCRPAEWRSSLPPVALSSKRARVGPSLTQNFSSRCTSMGLAGTLDADIGDRDPRDPASSVVFSSGCSISSRCQGMMRMAGGQQMTSDFTCGGIMCRNSVRDSAQDRARRASVLMVACMGALRECRASRYPCRYAYMWEVSRSLCASSKMMPLPCSSSSSLSPLPLLPFFFFFFAVFLSASGSACEWYAEKPEDVDEYFSCRDSELSLHASTTCIFWLGMTGMCQISMHSSCARYFSSISLEPCCPLRR